MTISTLPTQPDVYSISCQIYTWFFKINTLTFAKKRNKTLTLQKPTTYFELTVRRRRKRGTVAVWTILGWKASSTNFEFPPPTLVLSGRKNAKGKTIICTCFLFFWPKFGKFRDINFFEELRYSYDSKIWKPKLFPTDKRQSDLGAAELLQLFRLFFSSVNFFPSHLFLAYLVWAWVDSARFTSYVKIAGQNLENYETSIFFKIYEIHTLDRT